MFTAFAYLHTYLRIPTRLPTRLPKDTYNAYLHAYPRIPTTPTKSKEGAKEGA
jgi:hypothetical protein